MTGKALWTPGPPPRGERTADCPSWCQHKAPNPIFHESDYEICGDVSTRIRRIDGEKEGIQLLLDSPDDYPAEFNLAGLRRLIAHLQEQEKTLASEQT